MKLGPDMYHPNTFNIPKNEGVKNGQVWGGGLVGWSATKKPPENDIKLRESRL